MSANGELVKVYFELEKPELGTTGESLWAEPLGGNLYRIENSPWHVRTVNWMDVVEAESSEGSAEPVFVRVHERGGHKTLHLYFFETGLQRKEEILTHCQEFGAEIEILNHTFYALDIPPETDLKAVIDYFDSLQSQDWLDWRMNDYE